jgi:hypothetical protein
MVAVAETVAPVRTRVEYEEEVIRLFTIATLFWGVVAFAMGTFIAFQLAYPALNLGLEYTTFVAPARCSFSRDPGHEPRSLTVGARSGQQVRYLCGAIPISPFIRRRDRGRRRTPSSPAARGYPPASSP